ncbi:MAG: hypothetical protein AB7G93_17425 [Bdellovibrionales bacterium]
MKVFILLFSLLAVAGEARASQFSCEASNLVKIELVATYANSEGLPLTSDLTVMIEGHPFVVTRERIVRYANSIMGNSDQLSLTVESRDGTHEILEFDTIDGIGTINIDGWGIYFENVPITCVRQTQEHLTGS